MVYNFSLGFQDSATPIMEGIVDLHNYIFFYLLLILILVFWLLTYIIFDFAYQIFKPTSLVTLNLREEVLVAQKIRHGANLELFWTVTPSLILLLIAIPSFTLLYAMDEVMQPSITMKAIGHQWYWSYEYSDYLKVLFTKQNKLIWESKAYIFDSNLVLEDDMFWGEHRLLQTDNSVVLPTDTLIRILITSSDVLHSWAVPALGVKVDACPGRLNQAFIYLKREGVFYGQCSELCGVSHGFMPIAVKSVSPEHYQTWLRSKI
jgi:cytochrome c oxidase subunit 2